MWEVWQNLYQSALLAKGKWVGGWEESCNSASECVWESLCVRVPVRKEGTWAERDAKHRAWEFIAVWSSALYVHTKLTPVHRLAQTFPRVENGRAGIEQRWRGEERTNERLCPTRCPETEERSRSQEPQVYRSLLQAAYFLQPLHGLYLVREFGRSKTTINYILMYGKLL